VRRPFLLRGSEKQEKGSWGTGWVHWAWGIVLGWNCGVITVTLERGKIGCDAPWMKTIMRVIGIGIGLEA